MMTCVVHQLVTHPEFYDVLVTVQRLLLTLLSILFFFLKKDVYATCRGSQII